MTKVKICGIKRTEDCEILNELLPDYVGFVFAPKSKRYITPEISLKLREKLDRRIPTVGVFVNEHPQKIIEIAKAGAMNAIQLHGNEDFSTIIYLKSKTNLPIIKAFTVKDAEDVKNAMRCVADMLLLDNGCGTGEVFDHALLEDAYKPYILAGGLTPENVREAIKRHSPYCVDVSTGVETDGYKDPDKIRRFIEAVRK